MCHPMVFMVAMTVASMAAQAKQQQQQAEAQVKQQKYMNENFVAQAKATQQAAQADIDTLTAQERETNEAFNAEVLARQIESRKEAARASVAAGESGVAGVSTSMIERDILGKGLKDISTLEGNRQSRINQAQREKEAAARRGTTVGKGPKIQISKPDYAGIAIGGALSIGSDITSHYAGSKAKKLRTSKTPYHW